MPFLSAFLRWHDIHTRHGFCFLKDSKVWKITFFCPRAIPHGKVLALQFLAGLIRECPFVFSREDSLFVPWRLCLTGFVFSFSESFNNKHIFGELIIVSSSFINKGRDKFFNRKTAFGQDNSQWQRSVDQERTYITGCGQFYLIIVSFSCHKIGWAL